MTAIAYLVGVLVIALGIGLSIALHEIGHLVPAKKFGVKVTQYMVGFGPTVWSRTRGETEYGLKAIPLGGYIRMIGMFPPKPGDDPTHLRASSTGRFSQLMDQARQDSMDEVAPDDEHRVFYQLSVPKKVVVMMGGPVMNLLIATLLLGGIVTLYGVDTAQNGALVASVSECVVPASTGTTQTACKDTDPKTPAYVAGLRAKDVITSVDGQQVTPTTPLGDLVRPRGGQSTTIGFLRDGQPSTVTVTLVTNSVTQVGTDGKPLVGADGKPQVIDAGFLGVTSQVVAETVRQPVTAVPGLVWGAFTQTAGVIVHIPAKMAGVVQAAFGSGERDKNGPVSIVGVGRVGGEVASADLGAGGTMVKFMILLQLIASLNMALFVFNLVPLLPLDGGHVAGALWEGLKRNGARILGKADPGHVDVAKALPVAYTMALLLITMSALLIYADIVKPISLF